MTDPVRSAEAQRAAEIMLGSSLPSSMNSSVHSQTPSLPSYYSQPPPSYGSYLQHYHHPPQHQVPAGHRQVPAGHPHQPIHPSQSEGHPHPPFIPQTYPHSTHLPAHLSHLHYNGVGGGYRSQQFPVIMTDDLVSGTQHDGRMSPVRRFFVLFCTFDILFTSLLWIIAILVTGRDLTGELEQQVVEYTIHSSMFDCVVAAAGRFLICLTFYGLLDMSHWLPITVTTTSTVAFLIAKVFEYQWQIGEPITYDVMLVLLSFVLAWGEVWFFDFRLIPLERKAKQIWGAQPQRGQRDVREEDERTPLLAPSQGGMLQRFIEGSTLYEGSVGNYYSPFESPDNSDGEDVKETGVRIPKRFRRKMDHPITSQERGYIKTGEELLAAAWRILNSPDDWKLEKQLDNGDRVQVKQVKGKKVFRLTGYVNISPRQLLEELFYKIEQAPTWNPTLVDCRTIQPIDEHTDISYQVCAEAGGGVVSTRDFVNLRHWAVVEGVYVSAGGSITHPAMPPQHKKVRGENGPGCFAMRPVEGDPDMCLFQWLLDTDLKGWIPQSIIDKALSGAQFDYIAHIRTRAASLATEGLNTSVASCVDIVGQTGT
eukprot:GFUD01107644.1.p1 GENE.GFUD01107644.1~~GFUD01107644.1.p1  ORF type:complete len:594 (+),score=194.46 GFUD01107644.1:46-1827(+)